LRGKFPSLMLITKLFDWTESVIEISAHSLAQNFTVYHREILLDLFSTKYNSQQILLDCCDFEFGHLQHNGFWNFLESLTVEFSIPKHRVLILTTDKDWETPFSHQTVALSIFRSAHQWLKNSKDNLPGPEFEKPLDADARLLGSTIGRFCVPRLRLMYELDRHFASHELLLIFNQSREQVKNQLKFYRCEDQYQTELDWLDRRTFDQDDPDMSDIDQERYSATVANYANDDNAWHMRYHKLWPRFHIEIVAETDVFTSCVFTGKTARCLATGKPFVLLAAPNSLAELREMGFVTFGNVIDESYDQQLSFNNRISAMIQSLQNLNKSNQRTELLKKLHEQAKQNIRHYQSYIKNHV